MGEKTYYLYLSDWESAAGISMETNPRFADCEDAVETRNCVIGNLPSPELLLTSEDKMENIRIRKNIGTRPNWPRQVCEMKLTIG